MVNFIIERYDIKNEKWEEMKFILPFAFDPFNHLAIALEFKQSAKRVPFPFQNGLNSDNKILLIRFQKQNINLPQIDHFDPFTQTIKPFTYNRALSRLSKQAYPGNSIVNFSLVQY